MVHSSASAGSESVIRLIHKIWLAFKGEAIPNRTAVNIVMISPEVERVTETIPSFDIPVNAPPLLDRFFDHWQNDRPPGSYRTPVFAHVSPALSHRDPDVCHPKRRASLTPSPVIATTFPSFFSTRTIRTLCSGDTLANHADFL